MSSSQSQASQEALDTNRNLASAYYGVALPALSARQDSINSAMAGGEPAYLQQAYRDQRATVAEGIGQQGDTAQRSALAASKGAVMGGNKSSLFSASDMGAHLANAMYGSKFQEGMANIDQSRNLMSMALGGAASSGSGALNASAQELGAIRYFPQYNPTYANVAGGLAGAAGVYGAMNNAGAFSSSGNGLLNVGSGPGSGWGGGFPGAGA